MLTSRQVFPCRHSSPAMGAADVCNLAKGAISPGVTGSVTVTNGASVAQVRALRNPDRSDSQASPSTRPRTTSPSASHLAHKKRPANGGPPPTRTVYDVRDIVSDVSTHHLVGTAGFEPATP